MKRFKDRIRKIVKNEWTRLLAVVFLILVIMYIVAFKIIEIDISTNTGVSMLPTLPMKERFVLSYRIKNNRKLKRKDIVTIKSDKLIGKLDDEKADGITKRVVAIEGDTVEIKDGWVYINDEILDLQTKKFEFKSRPLYEKDGKLYKETTGSIETCPNYINMKKITLSKNEIFVLGDNFFGSTDSRTYGTFNTEKDKVYKLFKNKSIDKYPEDIIWGE